MTIFRSPRIVSLAIALFLAGAAFAQLRLGEESVPAPLRELLVWLFGHDARVASRGIVGIEFAAAAAVLVAGTRFLAVAISVIAAFFSLACVSRAVTNGGLFYPVVSLCAAVGLVLLARASVPTPPKEGRRGLSPAWPALGAIAAATFAGQWSASASFRVPGAPPAPAAQAERPTAPTIDLDMKAFEGRPLGESVLAKYVPKLVELCATRDAYIVVYSPPRELPLALHRHLRRASA